MTREERENALHWSCEDVISRQAVLDGIEELKKSPWATDKHGNGFEYLITEALEVVADLCVKQAPSVKPQEPKTDTWSIKEVAGALERHGLIREQEPCEDVIDRAEAMTEIMMFAGNVKSDEEDIYIKVSDAVQLLRELPPVKQEPKTDVLDKIRAEIEALIDWHDCPIEYDNGNDAWYREACNQAIKIIDKYRQER